MVRLATWDDLPRLISYISAFHAASPYAELEFSPGGTRVVLQNLIAHPSSCIFLHEHGAIAGEISTLRFGRARIAQEIFWWAERDGLRLLKAYEDWAMDKGAELIAMMDLSGNRLGKIYQRRGYQPSENLYLKEI